jgi:hypothetical protein
MDDKRTCCRCGREIVLCNGFTLARDIVDERIPTREHCGVCVEWLANIEASMREFYLRGIQG